MFSKILGGALAGVMLSALPAMSQSLSAADILAQVDQKVSGLNEYQKLLNDPDPARSMAAMQIMLESGDDELERMALDYGIYSPNPVVQRIALEAFFETEPVLSIFVKQAEGENNSNWLNYANRGSGSVLEDSRIYYSLKVGDFDEEKNCYTFSSNEDCMLRISDESVSYSMWGTWHRLVLNEQGQLTGSGSFPHSKKPVITEIQIGK